jgi:transcriptional regulator with XRE-family HTH domain
MNTTPAPDSEVISLANWARTVRDHLRLTRPKAAPALGMSIEYIRDIETGRNPSPEYLDNLITGYRLDPAQARLTRDLAQPALPLPPIEHLRAQVATPGRLELLARLDRVGILAAYIDPLWNILAANTSFHHALPGIEATGNIALWGFPPTSVRSPIAGLLLDCPREARFLIGMLRGAFGRYRTIPQAVHLYQQLRGNRDFTTRWNTSIHVAHGRPFHEPLRLRDPKTRQPYALDVQISEISGIPEIRCLTAWPPPPPGPPPS